MIDELPDREFAMEQLRRILRECIDPQTVLLWTNLTSFCAGRQLISREAMLETVGKSFPRNEGSLP